jgi:deazaflavin-dependent oxidoreductase (nitroreductase family)
LGAKIGKTLTQGFLGIHRTLYRVTKGKVGGAMGSMQLLLLTTTGRKTGKERTWPLAFFRDGENMIIVGSNGGQPRDPAWCYNLRSNPITTVQVGADTIKVRAEQANAEESERLWPLIIAQAANFAEYRKKTTREIPLMILHPIS